MDYIIDFTRLILILAGTCTTLVSLDQANKGKWLVAIYFLILTSILWSI
jgi:hypothetical protein